MKAEVGDTIEWNFKDNKFKDYPKHIKNKTFQSKVVIVDNDCYGVYAEYGQDLIPFDGCKIINKQ